MPLKARRSPPAWLLAASVAVGLAACSKAPIPPECAGPPLRGAAEYEEARQAGYEINPMHKCIDKASFERIDAEREQYRERQRAQRPAFPTRETTPAPAVP